eukprot:Skav223626  [mRNA]  locus=scaffold46:87419:88491:- [translate_table: standard]
MSIRAGVLHLGADSGQQSAMKEACVEVRSFAQRLVDICGDPVAVKVAPWRGDGMAWHGMAWRGTAQHVG